MDGEAKGDEIEATFVSVWDDGSEVVSTNCTIDPITDVVTSIEVADVEDVELMSLDCEYVALQDGTVHELVQVDGEYRVASPLPIDDIAFSSEIEERDGKLNFMLDAGYDMDAAFRLDAMDLERDDIAWASVDYDIRSAQVEPRVYVEVHHGDGSVEELDRWLTDADRESLLLKMMEYCISTKGLPLDEYARQARMDEGERSGEGAVCECDLGALCGLYPEGVTGGSTVGDISEEHIGDSAVEH